MEGIDTFVSRYRARFSRHKTRESSALDSTRGDDSRTESRSRRSHRKDSSHGDSGTSRVTKSREKKVSSYFPTTGTGNDEEDMELFLASLPDVDKSEKKTEKQKSSSSEGKMRRNRSGGRLLGQSPSQTSIPSRHALTRNRSRGERPVSISPTKGMLPSKQTAPSQDTTVEELTSRAALAAGLKLASDIPDNVSSLDEVSSPRNQQEKSSEFVRAEDRGSVEGRQARMSVLSSIGKSSVSSAEGMFGDSTMIDLDRLTAGAHYGATGGAGVAPSKLADRDSLVSKASTDARSPEKDVSRSMSQKKLAPHSPSAEEKQNASAEVSDVKVKDADSLNGLLNESVARAVEEAGKLSDTAIDKLSDVAGASEVPKVPQVSREKETKAFQLSAPAPEKVISSPAEIKPVSISVLDAESPVKPKKDVVSETQVSDILAIDVPSGVVSKSASRRKVDLAFRRSQTSLTILSPDTSTPSRPKGQISPAKESAAPLEHAVVAQAPAPLLAEEPAVAAADSARAEPSALRTPGTSSTRDGDAIKSPVGDSDKAKKKLSFPDSTAVDSLGKEKTTDVSETAEISTLHTPEISTTLAEEPAKSDDVGIRPLGVAEKEKPPSEVQTRAPIFPLLGGKQRQPAPQPQPAAGSAIQKYSQLSVSQEEGDSVLLRSMNATSALGTPSVSLDTSKVVGVDKQTSTEVVDVNACECQTELTVKELDSRKDAEARHEAAEQSKIAQLEKMMADSQKEVARLESLRVEANKLREEADGQKQELRAQVRRLEADVKTKEATIKFGEQRISGLEDKAEFAAKTHALTTEMLEEKKREHVAAKKQYDLDKQEQLSSYDKLKKEFEDLEAKYLDAKRSDYRLHVVSGGSLAQVSKSKIEEIEREIKQQETLITGYQKENEKLVRQCKNMQNLVNEGEKVKRGEFEKLQEEITSLKGELVGQATASRTQGEEQTPGVRVLMLEKQLEEGAMQKKKSDLEFKLTIEGLQREKNELEERLENVDVRRTEQDAKLIHELERSLMNEKSEHAQEVSSLKTKIEWYTENQKLLSEQEKQIREHEEKIRQLEGVHLKGGAVASKAGASHGKKAASGPGDVAKQRIRELERQVKEMQAIIRKRRPDSIPALIHATKEAEDALQSASLLKQLEDLQKDIMKKENEHDKNLRILRQDHEVVVGKYKEKVELLTRKAEEADGRKHLRRIKDLERQLEQARSTSSRNKAKKEEPDQKAVAAKKVKKPKAGPKKRGNVSQSTQDIRPLITLANGAMNAKLKEILDSLRKGISEEDEGSLSVKDAPRVREVLAEMEAITKHSVAVSTDNRASSGKPAEASTEQGPAGDVHEENMRAALAAKDQLKAELKRAVLNAQGEKEAVESRLREDIIQLEETLSSAVEQNKTLKHVVKRLRGEMAEAMNNESLHERALQEAGESSARRTKYVLADLHEATKKISQLRDKVAKQELQIEGLKQNQALDDVNRLSERLVSLENAVEQRSKDVLALVRERDDLKTQLATVRETSADLLSHKNSEIQRFKSELEFFMEEVKALEEEEI